MNWVKENFGKRKPPPKGWVTALEIVEQSGESISTVYRKLSQMHRNGVIESMKCYINGKAGKCYRKKSK